MSISSLETPQEITQPIKLDFPPLLSQAELCVLIENLYDAIKMKKLLVYLFVLAPDR